VDIKKDILWRVYLVYIFIGLFGVAVIARVVQIQVFEGEVWKKKAKEMTTAFRGIEAVRGNIFARDGSLLATSVPIYDVHMDMLADGITKQKFDENIDSLSICLSQMFPSKTKKEFVKELRTARRKGERYHFIAKEVRFTQLQDLKKFPLFRLGKYKGGLIAEQINKREFPFRELASRTLGSQREGIKPIGIEGSYNNYLKGVDGKITVQKLAGGITRPIHDDNEIEPKDGSDIYSTIDVNIQDVAHHALLTQLRKHNADHGCLALMEVKTGEIRAIVNLTRKDSGEYHEVYNYMIGESVEPGSTFKLASLIAVMEDGYADLDDTVNTENGTTRFHDRVMKDSHEGGFGRITLKRSFELSSNVAISKIVSRYYAKNPQRFVDRLFKMNLNSPLGLDIAGEGIPRIKSPKDKDWYGTTLPWMSIGYETQLTPLQILTFYNAVANEGVMVKPQFVKEIRRKGKVEKVFGPTIINESICSKQTIAKAKKMLEGVVETGTATNLKNSVYRIAGKTGTAQVAVNGSYKDKNAHVIYRASFTGYFPADNPKYSCIVVVSAPSNNVYYGNAVAGPIFREIADKVYSTSLDIRQIVKPDSGASAPPVVMNGYAKEADLVLEKLKVKRSASGKGEWMKADAGTKAVLQKKFDVKENLVPDVTGMSLKDALYLLENKGLAVKVQGRGKIVRQSIASGSLVTKGSQIVIELL
jgi:cell division protein FtsI (penicillin-binding protein 3)